jgi:transposase
VLDRVFAALQEEEIIRIRLEALSLDSTIVQVHPDGTGAGKKNGPQSIGRSRGGWSTKIHMVAADDRRAVTFSLTPGQHHDAPPAGREFLRQLPEPETKVALVMDRAYEGQNTRQLALELGFTPVVPPKRSRPVPWSYNEQLYRRHNEIERLFRRLKAFRRVFSRYDKLDVMFTAFIHFALIAEALRPCLV